MQLSRAEVIPLIITGHLAARADLTGHVDKDSASGSWFKVKHGASRRREPGDELLLAVVFLTLHG